MGPGKVPLRRGGIQAFIEDPQNLIQSLLRVLIINQAKGGCRTFGGCPLAADKWRWDIWRLENWRLRQMALDTFGGWDISRLTFGVSDNWRLDFWRPGHFPAKTFGVWKIGA